MTVGHVVRSIWTPWHYADKIGVQSDAGNDAEDAPPLNLPLPGGAENTPPPGERSVGPHCYLNFSETSYCVPAA